MQCFNISCVRYVIERLQPRSVDLKHQSSRCLNRINKQGILEYESLGPRYYVWAAPRAIFRRNLVPGKMCSCRGVLGLAGGLELLTADVVALWVASGDECGGIVDDVNVSGVYALPWILCRRAAGVRLTGTAP